MDSARHPAAGKGIRRTDVQWNGMDTIALYIQQHWAWTIAALGVVIALLSLSITIMAYKRATKAFVYRILIDSPIMGGLNLAIHKSVQLTLNERPITDVRLLVIELQNKGKELEPKDFHEPVAIVFPKGSELVHLQRSGASEGFSATFSVKATSQETGQSELERIELDPILMNHGEFVRISILASIPKEEAVTIKGRIAGIKIRKGTISPLAMMNNLGKVSMGIFSAIVLAIGFMTPQPNRFIVMEIMLALLLGMILVLIGDSMRT